MHSELHEAHCRDAQARVLQVARAYRIAAVATVYLELTDRDGFYRQNQQMKRRGFDGCFALHPLQADWALEIFSATRDEVEHARRVIEAYQAHGPITILDGSMIGPPMVKFAQCILDQHAAERQETAS